MTQSIIWPIGNIFFRVSCLKRTLLNEPEVFMTLGDLLSQTIFLAFFLSAKFIEPPGNDLEI